MFYDSQYLKYLRYAQNEYTPTFRYSEHLQAIDPSFVTITKQLDNKIGETFCEGLKCMCKVFEIYGQKYF